MIWVFLDESSATGTHEFADSVNNGPWGEALTTELIPWLEAHYRMDARANGRFLTGHSLGRLGDALAADPLPRHLRRHLVDLARPERLSRFHQCRSLRAGRQRLSPRRRHADAAGPRSWPPDRHLQQFAQLEAVLGAYGGQFASFDWVFSPRGPDGRPLQMFDRATGAVDPGGRAYWRDHYDIAWRLEHNWPALRRDLDGKIHIIVGTADTFHLDGPAHRLQAVLDRLGARSTSPSSPTAPISTCSGSPAIRWA